jgi:hypothetical protein
VQETHVSVNAIHALVYIGCEDAIPILRGSINIDDYSQRMFYFWAHTFVGVCNLKLKQCAALFKTTIPDIAADYEQPGQLLDLFEDVYLSFQKRLIGHIGYYGRCNGRGREQVMWMLLG